MSLCKISIILTENLWCDKNLEVKRKLRYYKEDINPNLKYQTYLFVFTSIKNKINIAKIRTNSYDLGQFLNIVE